MALPTIADSVADALNLAPVQTTDLLNVAPFVARLGAEESSDGVFHRYPVEDGAPTVGFRAENTGIDFSTDSDRIVNIELKILDWSHAVDKAVADAWRQGGKDAYMDRKGFRNLRAALSTYEKQVIYGTVAGAAAGFDGMADVLDGLSDAMVVSAGGTTVGTGSSVFAVRLGIDDVTGVYKGDSIANLGEMKEINMVDGTGKNFPAYHRGACSWLGLQVGSAFSFGRLANLTEDSGKTLTDDLIAELLSLFPTDRQPNVLLMNRRSLFQLRASRTATNATGAPAPIPAESFGVEIVPTDSILSTETLLA
jgi:hypothetical protein